MLWPKQTKKEAIAYSDSHKKQILLNSARHRANKRGLEFSITLNDFEIPEFCPYLKTPFVKGTRYAASLDRIASDLGYVPGNIEVISRKANTMKNDATVEELLEFAYTILERN